MMSQKWFLFFLLAGFSFSNLSCSAPQSPNSKKNRRVQESRDEVEGSNTPEEVPSPAPFSSIFGLEVVQGNREDGQSEIPQFHKRGSGRIVYYGPEEKIRDQNRITYLPKIFLRDPNSKEMERRRGLFFAWPDKVGRKKTIRGASYTHRAWNTAKKQLGVDQSKQVSYDDEGEFWYIPFSELFGGPGQIAVEDISPDDLQELHLDLSLSDGSFETLILQFQVAGPVPDIEVKSLPVVASNLMQFASGWGEYRWPIIARSFKNKTARPVTLWIYSRAGTPGVRSDEYRYPILFETHLERKSYTENVSSPPTPDLDVFASRALLELDAIEVEHENGDREETGPVNQRWVTVVLRPRETMKVEWVAQAPKPAQPCSLLMDKQLTLRWTEIPARIPRSQTVTESWKVIGASFGGPFNVEVRVDHPVLFDGSLGLDPSTLQNPQQTSASDSKPSEHSRLVLEDRRRVHESVGPWGGRFGGFKYEPCSGWFFVQETILKYGIGRKNKSQSP